MNKKRTGLVLVILGAVLILSALLLYLYNAYEDNQAGTESEEILNDVMTVIDTEPTPGGDSNDEGKESEIPDEMPIVVIDGYEYIGYLSIPDLKIELPVMSDWDYNKLKKAPCRQYGMTYTNDLVIAAHNYAKHFGRLSELPIGAHITFTDMEGVITEYELSEIKRVGPYEIDAVQNSPYDLVLYTCVYSGNARTVAGFERVS